MHFLLGCSAYFSSLFGQTEAEGRTLPGFRFKRNSAAVALYNFFADCQSDAGSRKLIAAMQTLEHDKDSFEVLRRDADSIVSYGKRQLLVSSKRKNVYAMCLGAVILNGIGHQILKQLRQLHLTHHYRRQRIVSDNRA